MTNRVIITDKNELHIEKVMSNQNHITNGDNSFLKEFLSFVICHLSFTL
jgi:hypothetical protein